MVAPLEQQINGVENMLYISSNSTGEGRFSIAVTFELGTNLDIAQVQVQNRVAIAQPRLPADVRNIGVTVAKASPDLMMVVHLYSPDKSRDPLFISNYANVEVTDVLTRVDGVGSITVFGGRDYSMRVWLDPGPAAVARPDGERRRHRAAGPERPGRVRRPQPAAGRPAGRVPDFGADARPAGRSGRVRRHRRQADARPRWCALKDVAHGRARRAGLLDQFLSRPRSGGRARDFPAARLERAGDRRRTSQATMDGAVEAISARRQIRPSSTTRPSSSSSRSTRCMETIVEAIVLVVLVVILFLQTWRAAIIPMVAIPVSLIGTFFFMAMFGFSLNNLSLFGLVLAVGIVVDDAIVVVENVERNIAAGLDAARGRAAQHGRGRPRAGRDRARAVRGVRAVGLHHRHLRPVLPAVRAHHRRRDGDFADRLADAVAGAVRAAAEAARPAARDRWWDGADARLLPRCSIGASTGSRGAMAGSPARVVRFAVIMLVVYAGVIALRPQRVPQDADRLHPATRPRLSDHRRRSCRPAPRSRAPTRCNRRARRHRAASARALRTRVNMVGFSGATFTNAPNAGAIFVVLEPFEERAKDPSQSAHAIQAELFASSSPRSRRRWCFVVLPPPVRGIGNAGGFRMMVEDRAGRGPAGAAGRGLRHDGRAPAQTPGLQQVFSLFETSTPQLYLDIDRTKAQMLGVNVPDVFAALQIYLGSSYVNDFNLFGRTFRVTAQAERRLPHRSRRTCSRSACAIQAATPCRSARSRPCATSPGPYRVPRYNLYPAAELDGAAAPGYSARARRSRSWRSSRPRRCRTASATSGRRSPSSRCAPATRRSSPSCSAVVFVFLVLAAQYESLTLPLAVILIVPMCLVASIIGVVLRGQDNNILTQVGFIVLIGLAAKNAILIVEFAKQLEDQGRDRWDAAVEAARLRLRPILMTSLAFIFGVTPMVWAIGAGAELRQTLGTAVFSGMIGVTVVRPDLHAGVLRGLPLARRPRPEGEAQSIDAGTAGRMSCVRRHRITRRERLNALRATRY